jgi:O-antigen/teichoic acid export membrane protein
MAKKVAHNIFTLVLSKILASIIAFVGYISIFHYLGKHGFGQFQYVLSYVMIFAVVVDFGIQQMVIKKVSEHREESKKYLGNFFAVEFFLALGIYILLAVIAFFVNTDKIVFYAILVTGLGTFMNALTIPHTAILSAHEDMHVIAYVNFFDSVINVAVMFAAIVFHKYIVFLALTQILMAILHWIVYTSLIHKYVPKPELWTFFRGFDLSLAKEMLIKALPFGLLVGFSILYNRIDMLILSHIRGYSEAGLYATAYKFVDLFAFFPAVVSSALYPYFSSQIKQGHTEAVRSALQNYTRFMIAVAAPLALAGAILAPKIILIWGSEGYMGFLALQILVFASAILFVYAAVNSIMINQLTRTALKISFANIFINAIGNILLIPHYGLRAAAGMTVFSELVQASLYFYFVRKNIISFHVLRFFVKPLISAMIMAAVIYPFRDRSIFLTLPAAGIIYFALILISGFFKRDDWVAAKSLFKRRSLAVNEENIG